MKNKTLIIIGAYAIIISVFCVVLFRYIEARDGVVQESPSSRFSTYQNHAEAQNAVGIIGVDASVSGIQNIEKLYPRSNRISWLSNDDIKKYNIDISKIESCVKIGDIPFSLNTKPSEYRIENKFHAASIVLTFNSYDMRNYPRYGYPKYGFETENYYLFFFPSRDNNDIQWHQGDGVQKKHPCSLIYWNCKLQNKTTPSH